MRSSDIASFNASGLSHFESWQTADGRSPQGEFLRAAATNLRRVFRSGNRVGKSTAGAVDTVLHCLGWHPAGRFRPPLRWWVSGLSWEVIGEVLWPAIRQFIPRSEINPNSIIWMRKAEPSIPIAVTLKNGSEIRFKSADAGREKYQGAKLHGVWIDEEQPADIVEECRARLMDYGGYLTVTLTPLRRSKWVIELEAEEGTATFRASMREAALAGLLDIDEVERYARSLPERQRRVRIEGDFVALEGAVYPDFARRTHAAFVRAGQLVIAGDIVESWPLPASWPRWAAVDWGFVNPTAVIVAARDPSLGRVYIERVYYASGLRAGAWAPMLRERLPRLRVGLISDHDAQAREELRAQGIPTTAADKAVERGLETVERMLAKRLADGHPELVFVLDERVDRKLGRCDAEKLAWELELYHYAPTREGRPDVRDLPVKANDHACDALRYLCVAIEKSRGGAPRPPSIKSARRQATHSLDMRKDLWL